METENPKYGTYPGYIANQRRRPQRYIDEFSVTGLTSNPTLFEKTIKDSDDYDASLRKRHAAGKSEEESSFELALEDLTHAADLFRPVHDATRGVDGRVSLELSSKLVDHTCAPVETAVALKALGIMPSALAARLQEEGAKAFEDSWDDLLRSIAAKSARLG